MHWYVDVLKKYAVFDGRASRSEYWYFTLFSVIISIILAVIGAAAQVGFLQGIYSLAVLLPSLGVTIRRLHDTNRSGWWWLIGIIPVIGWIWIIILLASGGDGGSNNYGPDPWDTQTSQA